jgi:hypothetical protein
VRLAQHTLGPPRDPADTIPGELAAILLHHLKA